MTKLEFHYEKPQLKIKMNSLKCAEVLINMLNYLRMSDGRICFEHPRKHFQMKRLFYFLVSIF